jgi:hypothetical protein
MKRNLDLLDLLRRLKMHGLALTATLEKVTMKFISRRLVSQPLSEIKDFQPKTQWDKYEVMTQ